MQVDANPQDWLAKELSAPSLPSELRPYVDLFARYYEQRRASSFRRSALAHAYRDHNRLWYQLTLTIEEFLRQSRSAPFQIGLYRQFIEPFSNKLNQLKLASIGITVSRQFSGSSDTFFDTVLTRLIERERRQ